jgi:glycogen(starch) synthase
VRILCIGNRYPPWSIGGYEILWAGAAQWLRGAGHGVRILTTLPDPSDAPGDAGADVHRELRWYWRDHEFPRLTLGERFRLERANAGILRRHLAEFSPDAVFWWGMGGMSLSLIEQVRRARVPAAGAVCDDWMAYGPQVDQWLQTWRRGGSGLAELAGGVPVRIDLDRAAHWALISQYTLDSARRAGWRLPGAVVAHAGIDRDRVPFEAPGPWRWRLLYCGRLDPRKGTVTALESLPNLPSEATLTLIGDGNDRHRGELEALAERLGVAGRVRFGTSQPDQIGAVYAHADALVFPVTWQEPWGLVPLEAMAVGRPVVASNAGGGVAEYLRSEQNCLTVPPGDAASLAAALRRLAADAELRARLVASGSETAARFTSTHFHEALERLLLLTAGRGVRSIP